MVKCVGGVKELAAKEVGEVAHLTPGYPSLLNSVSDAPKTLYYLGNYREELFKNTLAVVGSRAVTLYGEWVINTIVKAVARAGITIVSGFMYGVDALAHRVALEVAGSTIAVMAGGINQILPSYQEELYYNIVASGLVVSEFYKIPEFGRWMFAKRNRIVAGLSYATLVVEAAADSGSLITADYARKYGRQLLAVPANLNSRNAVGTTQLLRDGAKMVTCADDVLQLYFGAPNNYRHNISNAVNKRLLLATDEEDGRFAGDPRHTIASAETVLELLCLEPLSADELSEKLLASSTAILRCLTELSILGRVLERDGRYYVG